MTDAKMLALDIETAPHLGYFFDTFKPVIGFQQVIEPGRMIAFSAQKYGEKKVRFHSEYHDGREAMLDELDNLLQDTDIVVHYNGKRFDMPYIRGEFIAEHRTPPPPPLQIDLFQAVRANSRWASRKLDYVAQRLLEDRKVEHTGFQMWLDCLRGDEDTKRKGWALMKRYAIKDTRLLFPLFEELRPWLKMPHPITDNPNACHQCGSTDLQRRGVRKTAYSEYPRFRCNSCGTWLRGTTRTPITDLRPL